MTRIDVHCEPAADGWRCTVGLGDDGAAPTEHVVRVGVTDLARLAPGASEPIGLVRRSFEFLLQREPRESILRSFELPLIGRYFPDYEDAIRRR